MKQIIKDVLDDMSESQINLASDAARETISSLISATLKSKGNYTEFQTNESYANINDKGEQSAKESWVCHICGQSTYDVEYDYIGSGANHLQCELEEEVIGGRVEFEEPEPRIVDDAGVDIETGKYAGGSEEIDGAYTPDEYEGWEKAVGYKEDDDIPEGLKKAKELSREAMEEGLKRQLSEEIIDNKDEKFIYESTDGGKTIYKRNFGETEKKIHKENNNEG
tara:strand:+ start:968 stop:1636 length:669 start_codon:yes stop_codon:yes gene_type:complete